MSFLPKEYKIPESPSQYMKFQEGRNVLRVLSSAIIGWLYWTTDEKGNRKPTRVKTEKEVPDKYKKKTASRGRAKHFWAFVVYNSETTSIQILELTQKTLMRQFQALIGSPEWGDPKGYNIIVNKSKTGPKDRDVEYSIMPEPKEELDKNILEYYKSLKVNLNALYDNEDPFEVVEEEKKSE